MRSAKSAQSRKGSRKGSSRARPAIGSLPNAKAGRAKGRLLSKVPGTGDFGVYERKAAVRGTGVHATDYRSELEQIYTRHAPERVKNIGALLNKYRGREERLVQMVRKKYAKQK